MAYSDLYIHGYDIRDSREVFGERDSSDKHKDWTAEFDRLEKELRAFLSCRDTYLALAKTAHQCISETLLFREKYPSIELAGLEVLQALFLTISDHDKKAPTSPRNFSKHWAVLRNFLNAFTKKHSQTLNAGDAVEVLKWRTKLQTIYYRFPFDQDICREIVSDVLRRVDQKGKQNTNFSGEYETLVQVSMIVADRFQEFMGNVAKLMRTDTSEAAIFQIEFFCARSEVASRLWQQCKSKPWSTEQLQKLGYQLSELATPWIFKLDTNFLEARFGADVIPLLERFSLRPGDLPADQLERYIMDNPVWEKPFILLPGSGFMLPIQYFPFSYPFRIAEALLGADQKLLASYSKARAEHLEDAVADTLKRAMPSATVYRNVLWDDPGSGIRYENDIVVVLGNFVFLFEAKSGKISPSARRGAQKRLVKNISELFINPRTQSERLQRYLNEHGSSARLWEEETGRELAIDLAKPKLAFSYSVCFEHFAALSSSKHYYVSSGLVDEETVWAPVLSLGELHMLFKFLDSEMAFVHYLTRRFWIGEQIDFDGDEQDLLSMYMANGFCLLGDVPKDKRVLLHDSDDSVRVRKEPAANRCTAQVVGVELPPLWKNTVEEIYRSTVGTARHKFDIICTILNQPPPALLQLQKRVKGWRRGAGGAGKGPQYSRYVVASRQFVLATTMLGKGVYDEDVLKNEARMLASDVAHGFEGVTDVAVFLYRKKSAEMTHDGVFFFRVGPEGMDLVV